jgi:cell surface protein SprA
LRSTYISGSLLLSLFALLSVASPIQQLREAQWAIPPFPEEDTLRSKSGRKPYNANKDRWSSQFSAKKPRSPLSISEPSGLKTTFQLDSGKKIAITEQLTTPDSKKGLLYRPLEFTPVSTYIERQRTHISSDLWRSNAKKYDGQSEVSGRGLFPKIQLGDGLDRLFGSNVVEFKPNGYVLLDFGIMSQSIDNPAIPIRQRNTTNFNFNEQAAINFNGKIGDNMNLNANFDTKASFNFQNKLKLNYRSKEEDIIQKIEAGNTSFQVPSQLIPGVQNLFGLKTQLRFGKLDATVIAAQQRSKQQRITIRNGVQNKGFEIKADQYDENRHFFLSQYFRNNYERSLKSLPVITSGINITRVEVYVTNRTNTTESLRNLVAVTDIGESGNGSLTPVDNAATPLFGKIVNDNGVRQVDRTTASMNSFSLMSGQDYEVLRGAKRLTEREYRFHPELGYISLISPLRNDEVLAVSYEYTLNGRKHKVGEMTEDYQNRKDDQVLVLKMLKSSNIRNNLNLPIWNLMMKNVYSLNTTNVAKQGFQLRVIYKDDRTGIDNPNLQEGKYLKDVPLLQVMGLDRLNVQLDPQPDGNFDFVEGVTIDSKNGKLYFPVLEPFGNTLRQKFDVSESELAEKYVFDKLYRSTQIDAAQTTDKTKFFLKGTSQNSLGGEAQLPFGVDPNSVKVSAGGAPLMKGTDYTVDQSGKVRINNVSVSNSGQDIFIDYEQPDLFNNQIRTLVGGRFDYTLSKDMRLGATVMKYDETPPANLRRVSIGNEPVSNTIFGVDAAIRKESRWLTRALDKLPLLSTKETSVIDFQGEYAKLIPGVASRVQDRSYIDDFEGARTIYDLTRQPTQWRLGATPKTFLLNGADNTLSYAYRRAKISVYSIDNTFYGLGGGFANAPTNLTDADLSNHYEKQVSPQSIFPNKAVANGFNVPIGLLDMYYNPSERGQYNYTTALNADGSLKNPRQNYGAITRAITSDIDFDNANIENVEFWMMNPFINDSRGVVKATGNANIDKPNTTGGTLYLNLGDISEDVIPDGRYNYENGLPLVDKEVGKNVDKSAWGYAPRSQFVTRAFSNQPGARPKQDVGLDGLNNEEEKIFFQDYLSKLTGLVNPDALQKIVKDPSADDFEFYFSQEANDNNKKIVQRYKSYIGYENNTPELNTDADLSQTNSYLPDVEDLNTDNTINDNEAYYQYKIDLKPNQMDVGKGYIIDKVTTDGADWFLFRVPVRNFTDKVGAINGFKSIRFMRLVTTDFEQPVVMRFAQFQITGYQWRKYTGDFMTKGLTSVIEREDSPFKVQTVSIEENGASDKSGTNITPYVLPPGFERDRDLTTINNASLNEQSMSLSVTNLKDGDARAVFKNVNFDLVNYKRLKMWTHLEAMGTLRPEEVNKQVSSFIRLGTDLTDNYYEIEIRELSATNPESITKTAPEPEKVWPAENIFDVAFDELRQVKADRNKTGAAFSLPHTKPSADGKFNISVVGNPDLSTIVTLMIGVKNPKSNDNQAKSFRVWVNELLAEGFDQTSGYAAVGRLNLKLADFATVTINGAIKTYGFGGVTDKISSRERATTLNYGIQANIQLDKLLPEKWGMKIPLYINHSRNNVSPHFNPLDPDMPLATSLESENDAAKRERLRQVAEDNTVRQGINLSNVRKVKTNPNAKRHAYDVENLTVTYAYSSTNRTSPTIAEYKQESHKGAITYQYQPQAKSIEPFKNSKVELIRDFNITPLPSSISVVADMDRSFVKTQYRNADLTTAGVSPLFEKYWMFNRRYDVAWNFTKSVVLNYNAMANAIIDEPKGDLDTDYKRDSVLTNLRRFGRTKNYDHRMSATYRIPLDKTRILDWITADYSYKSGYVYIASSYNLTDSLGLPFGNIIKNNREQVLSGRFDLVKLYNKVRYLRFANTPNRVKKNFTRNPGDFEEAPPEPSPIAKAATRLLMAIRGINFNYTVLETTTLPGFLPSPKLLGMAQGMDNAPGFDFVMGSQDPTIRFTAAEKGWLTKSTVQNVPFVQTKTKRLDFKTNIEPWKDFKVTLAANFERNDNYSEFFRPETPNGDFVSQSPVRGGSFRMSFLSFGTSFDKLYSDNSSPTFEKFKEYRDVIINRLNKDNPNNAEKKGTYDPQSQDVLIPAFFAAYAKRDPNTVSLSPFYNIPFPNWRLDYTGLVNSFPKLKKYFSSVNITHSFTSTYSVGTFTSSLEYGAKDVGFSSPLYPFAAVANSQGIYVPVYIMSVISIAEKFSPLLGLQIRTKNNTSLLLEYNQERNVSLNLSNTSLADLTNRGLKIGFGLTRNNFKLPIRSNGKQIVLKNDLRFDFNMTINDTRAILRKLDGEIVPTSGNYNFQLSPKITYKVNKKLDLTIYLDRLVNDPIVTNSFKRSTTSAGFRLRFDLAQ